MIAPDTSVIVAAFACWHERHADALRSLRSGARLLGQCALETYSVLTRLPAPHRAPPDIVADYLVACFAKPWIVLPERELRRLLDQLPALRITGGAVYDALVAAAASHAGVELVSFDARPARTYEALGVAHHVHQSSFTSVATPANYASLRETWRVRSAQ